MCLKININIGTKYSAYFCCLYEKLCFNILGIVTKSIILKYYNNLNTNNYILSVTLLCIR